MASWNPSDSIDDKKETPISEDDKAKVQGEIIKLEKDFEQIKLEKNSEEDEISDGDGIKSEEESDESSDDDDDVKKNSVKSGKMDPSRHKTLHGHCRELFGLRPNVQLVACNLCNATKKLTDDRGCLKTKSIIDHARFHSEIKPFECVPCKQRFAEKRSVVSHLTNNHDVSKSTAFVDRSSEFHDQVSDAIEKCFAECRPATMSKEDMKRKKAENMIRGQSKGKSELATERQLLCNRLIKKAIDAERKVKCGVCLKRIVIRKPRCAVLHAYCHLDKPLYRCNQCKKSYHNYNAIRDHLRTVHVLPMAKNHKDLCDDYDAEITAMLYKCFEGNATPAQSQQLQTKRVEKEMPIKRGDSTDTTAPIGISETGEGAATSSSNLDPPRSSASTDSLEKTSDNEPKRPDDDSKREFRSIGVGTSPLPVKKTMSTQTYLS